MDKHPPKLALQLFRWYCAADRLEELEGDLLEQFEIDVDLKRKCPRLKFWWNVIRCAKAYSIKRKERHKKSNMIMLRTNIILVFRNFKKSSLYATLNILGLSLTIAVVTTWTSCTQDERLKSSAKIAKRGVNLNFIGR